MLRPIITQRVIDTFAQVLDDQDRKGIEKYGKSIDEAEGYDWKLMALEEAADLVKYLMKELQEQKIKKLESILPLKDEDDGDYRMRRIHELTGKSIKTYGALTVDEVKELKNHARVLNLACTEAIQYYVEDQNSKED